MMAPTTMRRTDRGRQLALQSGPRWSSIEQLRKGGARQLEERLGPGQIGWLRARNKEYIIVQDSTWHEVYGRAQEVSRLEGTLVMLRKAIRLAFNMREGSERLALEHLSDLVFHIRELPTESHEQQELVFDDVEGDEEDIEVGDLELEPTKVQRPGQSRR